jgi:organic radical activating enzyme
MNVWCKDPFVHVDIVVENDSVSYYPCNVYAKKSPLLDFNKIKEDLASGNWAEGCEFCKSAESSGLRSRRIGVNDIHKNINLTAGIQSVGLRYGTLCNSTCLICDESRSSAWATEKIKKNIPIKSNFQYNKSMMPKLENIFNSIDLKKLTHIEFHGGEPLMNMYPWEMLKLLNANNVSVKFNTNGTIMPDKIIDFVNCKSVEMLFSIDDINERLEYLRPPAKFGTILDNVEKSKILKFNTGCTYTMSSLNIFYLPEFLTWALKTFGPRLFGQHLFADDKFNLYNLNDYAKQCVDNKFSQYPHLFKLLKIALFEMQKPKKKDDIELIDLAKTDKYKTTFPEWAKVLTHE